MLTPLRVLVVEDNPINLRLVVRLLQKNGHEVFTAGNGLEALCCLQQQSVDVVLMDIQMPEMDGLTATRMIREKELGTSHHVPIVAVTAHALTGDREKCLDAGMDGYVTKPILEAVLFQAMSESLNSQTHQQRA